MLEQLRAQHTRALYLHPPLAPSIYYIYHIYIYNSSVSILPSTDIYVLYNTDHI